MNEQGTAEGVLGVHAHHGESMNAIVLSACWNRLAKLSREPPERVWLRNNQSKLRPLLLQTEAQLHRFDARPVASTAHGLATLGSKIGWTAGEHVWRGLEARALLQAGELNAQGLSNTAWAFAKAGHSSPALFAAIETQVAARASELNAQELSNTGWAFAKAGHSSPALFAAIAKQVAARAGELTAQGLSNTAWAFAVLDEPADILFHSGSRFHDACVASAFTSEDLCQVHQFLLWRMECGAHLPLPPELRQSCLDAFVAHEGSPSRLQAQVAASLAALGLQVEEEHRTEIGYSLDALVPWRGVRVAVEVDGPSHFVGGSRVPTGATALKRRQLRTLGGWPLLTIPYWEWGELNGAGVSEVEAYLRRGLDAAVEAAGQSPHTPLISSSIDISSG